MKDTILSIIRHLLTFGGGFLTAQGIISSSGWETLASAIATLVGAGWGAYDEYAAAKKAKVAAASTTTASATTTS